MPLKPCQDVRRGDHQRGVVVRDCAALPLPVRVAVIEKARHSRRYVKQFRHSAHGF